MADTPLLAVRGITKRFPGTLALDDFDLEVHAGEVHALLGENGAGKSTFIKVLAGVYAPDAGTIHLAGAPLRHGRGAAEGVAFIHQDLALVDSMTVMENIGHVSGFPRRAGLISWRALYRQSAATLSRLEADIDPASLVSRLSQAQKSIVAIARAFATPNVRLLVLDEPTASLPEEDVARVFRTLQRLKEQAVGMIFVTHRLDEVFRIADRVTVMRDGRRVTTTTTRDADRESLVGAIIGRAPDEVFVRDTHHRPGPAVVELRRRRRRHHRTLLVRVGAGEVVGTGGARRRRPERHRPAAGRRYRIGERRHQISARRSTSGPPPGAPWISASASYRPSVARKAWRWTSRSEKTCSSIHRSPTGPLRRWIRPAAERRDAHDLMRRFGVRASDPDVLVAALSGGNQQKVVLARWLSADRRLLVLEEPTAGVDVGAKAEIYRLLLESLQQGCAVLLVSSDFEEVCGIAGRALVFYRGRIVAELAGPELSMARLVRAATGDTVSAGAQHG